MRIRLLSHATSHSAFRTTPKQLLNIRKMSSKPQYLVIVKDFPGMLQKRVEVRQEHLSVARQNQAVVGGGFYCQLASRAYWPALGAIFSKEPTPEDPTPFAVRGNKKIWTDGREARLLWKVIQNRRLLILWRMMSTTRTECGMSIEQKSYRWSWYLSDHNSRNGGTGTIIL